ncbi:hypothetical protein SmJEL517_g02145 [Synchytrium microbalum]|uniref:Sof1-like protein domain-containing protein n=1 Tax=Synchytrium microbalum TaxID=1806994 RepID=A0A507CDD3_9FUNG|nr:uncharacterized protein SmJEL517_g02145 [Synchytrium microbalum]TPX35575.1 hypothetical protein SmJEL517_g02145 [Synchytrium microbalum]
MKIKTLSRSDVYYERDRSTDLHKLQRNLNPELHPFERAREYTRALNATKLERLFAKPFIGALSGHVDGVYCMAKHQLNLDVVVTGSADGEVRYWSLADQEATWNVPTAHKGFVRGVCTHPNTPVFLSCGDDKAVKIWDVSSTTPKNVFLSKFAFTGIDHSRNKNIFATSAAQVELWDIERSQPTYSFSWGAETVTSLKFNQTETNILASCGTDRTVALYDLRTTSPLNRIIMEMRTNAIAWNPMEAFHFTIANEDHKCYTFDMRRMDAALIVHMDHVSAVMDLDYSPTGAEFVTGSYDRSVRIFNTRERNSREVYHTKRMQRVFCVRYSMDSKFVISGSDDGNVRIWKAQSNDRLGVQAPRSQNSMHYQQAVKNRYKNMPEIKRIDKHRHVPKPILSAQSKKKVMLDSRARKEENERKHSQKKRRVVAEDGDEAGAANSSNSPVMGKKTKKTDGERHKHILAVEA